MFKKEVTKVAFTLDGVSDYEDARLRVREFAQGFFGAGLDLEMYMELEPQVVRGFEGSPESYRAEGEIWLLEPTEAFRHQYPS